jgi:uncharacterized protein
MTELRPRHATDVARRKIAAARGVVINGPRQAGKSELLRILHESLGGTLMTLDRTAHLRLARTDPAGFVQDRPKPLMIDEVQRGGDPLVLAIKELLDSSRDRGQAVLAGSTRFLTEPRLSESLAGRIRFVDLWTFSQGEIDGLTDAGDRIIDRLFIPTDALLQSSASSPSLARSDIFDRVCMGGYPEAVAASAGRDRMEFFADYIRTVSKRDIIEMGRIGENVEFQTVLSLLAERTASLSNTANLSRAAGMSADSMRRYLPLLETIFLTYRLPAFAGSVAATMRRHPKLHLTDTGLAAHLLGMNAARLMDPDATASGPLLESFVLMELVKQTTWSNELVRLSHYRDDKDREIDIIVQAQDGRVAGVEVKAAIDVDERDFRHLAYLRDKLGDRFTNGIVFHCGTEPLHWGDRLVSLPISALWHPPS